MFHHDIITKDSLFISNALLSIIRLRTTSLGYGPVDHELHGFIMNIIVSHHRLRI